jgi:anti-sigma B factor antagonist
VALFPFRPFRALSRPVPVAVLPRRAARVTGRHDLVTGAAGQPDGPGPDPAGTTVPQPDRQARPRPGRAAIELNDGRDATTVFIRGELDLTTAPVLDEQLRLAVANKPARLVLDMSGTDFLDCGCARLIATARSALPADADMTIRQPSRAVRRVLELTGLDVYCEMHE